VKSVKTQPTPTTETKKPDKQPQPVPKYEMTEAEKKKITAYKNELLNILIKVNFDFEDEPNVNAIIAKYNKADNKDKPVG
jgi:hypothetical protein